MFKKKPKVTSYILLVAITISGISTFMIYPLLVFRLLDVGASIGEIGLVLEHYQAPEEFALSS